MKAQASRRRRSFAQRGHEQREIARRREEDAAAVEAARGRLLDHLTAARVSALEGRMVMVAAEIDELIRVARR